MLFRNNYGVDLGSSSVKVYSFFRNKSYIEKNMVAYRGRRILAIGNEAYEMFEKSPADISVNSPMAFGMLANLELQEIVLYSMIKKIDHTSGLGADMYFSVPLDMTAIEKRAYYHLSMVTGCGKTVFLWWSPLLQMPLPWESTLKRIRAA